MIKELCDRHGVTCAYTSKLFFNRFTSSITVNFPAEHRAGYEAKDRDIRRAHSYATVGEAYQTMSSELRAANEAAKAERHDFVTTLFMRFSNAFPEGTEFRMNKVSVTFYHDDPTSLTTLIEALKGQIVKVTVPRDEAEIAFLRANTDKLLQDQYFFDRYPYKVTFKHAFDHSYLNDYIKNQFSTADADVDFDRAHYYPGATPSQPVLYLAHFDDLFLTKIGVQELIEKVQEVVLRNA